jgi:hypothetical protein
MSRRTVFGVALALLLACSHVTLFKVEMPEVNALTLFSDDFANLSNWTAAEGEWTVSNGVLEGNGSAEALVWAGSTSWTNYDVTANIRMFSPGGDAVIVVRYTDLGNFYWVGLGSWGHKYSITKVENYVHTELAHSGLVSELEPDKWYTVSVVVIDSTLQLFVDGFLVLTVEDNSIPSGAVGFGTYGGTMQAVQMVVQSRGWNKIFERIGDETASSIVQASDGGYVLAGGNWLVRTDSAGNMLWDKTCAGGIGSLIKTSDGGYAIAGSSDGDAWLAKTDSAGNQQWDKTYGGAGSESFSSVVQTSDGGYALAGSTTSFGEGEKDFWLVKIDSAGNQQWTKTYGGENDENAFCKVQTSARNSLFSHVRFFLVC